MPNLLPTLFIIFGACALVVTLYWLWQSLRQTFAHVEEAQVATETTSSARAALLAEKQSLLVALKDLESERDNGKLSEADFSELNARYRARARSVLKALDTQLAPHREAAKALLRGAASADAGMGADKPVKSAKAATAATSDLATRTCGSCSTVNDADAAFCKKCGAKLQATGASS
jgi:rRNA maturation endonuclease Nob1